MNNTFELKRQIPGEFQTYIEQCFQENPILDVESQVDQNDCEHFEQSGLTSAGLIVTRKCQNAKSYKPANVGYNFSFDLFLRLLRDLLLVLKIKESDGSAVLALYNALLSLKEGVTLDLSSDELDIVLLVSRDDPGRQGIDEEDLKHMMVSQWDNANSDGHTSSDSRFYQAINLLYRKRCLAITDGIVQLQEQVLLLS